KLEENAKLAKTLPVVDADLNDTEIGRFLDQLSGNSSIKEFDSLVEKMPVSQEVIDGLKDEEARLRLADTSKERQSLIRQAAKLESLRIQLDDLQKMLGNEALMALQGERDKINGLEGAAD